MSSIRVRVGASLDASVNAVFSQLEKAAERSKRNLDKVFAEAAKGTGKVRTAAKKEGDALDKELEAMANKQIRTEDRKQKQLTKLAEQGAKARERENEKLLAQVDRDNERAAKREEQRANARSRAMSKSIMGGLGTSMRLVRGGASLVGGIAAEALEGMGLDLSVGSHMANATEFKQRIADVTNAGYIPGAAGAQGQLQTEGDVRGDVEKAANKGAFSMNESAEGLQKFVGLTGDLETGRKSLELMAVTARATGSSLEHMAEMGGEIVNHLGEVPDKSAALAKVMNIIAGQGKLGSVEIKSLATQMAKLAAQAGKFEGGTVANIGEMGILAQVSKGEGGSASATNAATAVVSFARDITKSTTLKHWAGAGLSPFADKGHTTLRSPEELILESLRYSKGSLDKLGNLFPNSASMRVAGGFAKIYNDTSGDENAKLQAVAETFNRMRRAALSAEEVQRAYTEAMDTGKSQIQLANNRLDQMAGRIQDAMLPALAGLAPALEKLIDPATELANGFATLLGNITGASGDKAKDDADKLNGTLGKDQQALLDTTGKQFVPGKGMVPVYSGQALDVLRAHGAKRAAATGELEGQIGLKKDEANRNEDGVEWFKPWIKHLVGQQSNAEIAAKDRVDAAAMQKKLDQANLEAAQSNTLLAKISRDIATGAAIRTAVPPPPKPSPGSVQPAEASDQ